VQVGLGHGRPGDMVERHRGVWGRTSCRLRPAPPWSGGLPPPFSLAPMPDARQGLSATRRRLTRSRSAQHREEAFGGFDGGGRIDPGPADGGVPEAACDARRQPRRSRPSSRTASRSQRTRLSSAARRHDKPAETAEPSSRVIFRPIRTCSSPRKCPSARPSSLSRFSSSRSESMPRPCAGRVRRASPARRHHDAPTS
jgi:hypothetical protein